jgi:hypothetical protein
MSLYLKKIGVLLIHSVEECSSVQIYNKFKKKLKPHAAFFAAASSLTDYISFVLSVTCKDEALKSLNNALTILQGQRMRLNDFRGFTDYIYVRRTNTKKLIRYLTTNRDRPIYSWYCNILIDSLCLLQLKPNPRH